MDNHTLLDKLQGIYRGFAPTDESPTMMGELEISITTDAMKARMATGLKIEEDEVPILSLNPMTREEICTIYSDGSEYIDRSIGFSMRGMKYLFLLDANGTQEAGLLIIGNQMADMLGQTMLYNPQQIAKGVYNEAVGLLESKFGKRCFPTLDAGGRLPK